MLRADELLVVVLAGDREGVEVLALVDDDEVPVGVPVVDVDAVGVATSSPHVCPRALLAAHAAATRRRLPIAWSTSARLA
ncbi:hypothetical protein [Nostocoides vanveenii]|uniref:hypothetical protein n=1 Tax=Nostocoides vanveenii TaxID=330835 RepID=UPI0031D0C151